MIKVWFIAYRNPNTANRPLHRDAFCHFPFRWIYYCHRSKSTGKELAKRNSVHCWSLEHGNRQKSPTHVWHCFYVYLINGSQKHPKKNFMVAFWDNPHHLFWTGRLNLKIFFWYYNNYLSIWPFLCHPWFPTRKASKLTFVCFQLAGRWHHPISR